MWHCVVMGLPSPKQQILDSFKLKDYYDENGRKFWVNLQTGRKCFGKGDIAHNKQFLLFPQCIQKTCTPDT